VRTPDCHPDREHVAFGLCSPCYYRDWYARWRAVNPRTNHRALELAARAERMRAELEAAGPYATLPCTWPAIAERLGVKPATLERARTRARQYAAREAS
jgi:hypothetical protein